MPLATQGCASPGRDCTNSQAFWPLVSLVPFSNSICFSVSFMVNYLLPYLRSRASQFIVRRFREYPFSIQDRMPAAIQG